MINMLKAAKAAKMAVCALSTEQKNAALEAMADALLENEAEVLAANALDLEKAKGTVSDVMLDRLLELEALPIINENDTVATDEIVIGDNDTLAAIVAESVGADKLVLLSDIDGLYTADPHKDLNAKLLDFVSEITDEIRALGGGSAGSQGTGGMATKLRAAKMVTNAGCDMIIANGEKPGYLYDIVEGKAVGTRFLGKK